eukprot:scaffold13935_cov71-Cyclotella_meneghiniana.AAC.8
MGYAKAAKKERDEMDEQEMLVEEAQTGQIGKHGRFRNPSLLAAKREFFTASATLLLDDHSYIPPISILFLVTSIHP